MPETARNRQSEICEVCLLKDSIGFQEMALEARARVVLDSGDEVRRSYLNSVSFRGARIRDAYRTIERSVAQEARIEVSVWLKLTAVMVSVEVGQ